MGELRTEKLHFTGHLIDSQERGIIHINFPKALIVAASVLLGSVQAQDAACNRTCLEGVMSDYLNAFATHDPSPLSLAPFLLYTEND
jgi:hypothetical protein